jgi:exopolysaccharide biosynthesis polyprenyl glycosylphosphotransferase
MNLTNKFKVFLLFVGDALALYATLFVVLLLRYGGAFYDQFVDKHLLPFTIIFTLWLIIFYVAGLYDLRHLRNNLDFLKNLGLTLFISAAFAVFFFYLIPAFGITPKTNLFLFVVIFAAIEIFWRRTFNKFAASDEAPNKVLLIGNTATATEINEVIKSNPQLGYEIKARFGEERASSSPRALEKLVDENKVNLVVIPRHLKRNSRLAAELYELLTLGTEIHDLTNFYEFVMRKVPLADLEETWFLENLTNRKIFYDQLKRALEFLAAFLLFIVLSPIEALIAVVIKITSPGPIIYRQIRVGENGRNFVLYKFRTMPADAEKDGVRWAAPGDKRATTFGRFLRYTHLDELPQLVNIMKGDLSFVGPRPERPEFVKTLKERIPYYETRLLVKPGVTGWAQINYRKDSTIEDVKEKIQYDIYYIKNRSLVLDLAIILKTLKSLFVMPK